MSPEYLSGFFDGDGCISIRKGSTNRYVCQASIGQKFPRVLRKIKNFLGYGKIRLNRKRGSYYFWVSRLSEIQSFIELILPYSIVKRSQLVEADKFLKLRNNLTVLQQKRFFLRLKKLKRRKEW